MAEYYTQSESDARYAAKTHTHALESMGGNNLPADRVEVPESVSASFGNAYTLDEALESIANHTHTGYAPANHTHTLDTHDIAIADDSSVAFATTDTLFDALENLDNRIDGRAPLTHIHTNYADADHTHTADDITGLPASVDAYSKTQSDARYAAASHTHGDYMTESDAEDVFAPINHSHSGYAASNHSHTGYASSGHTHTASEVGAAASSHTHTPRIHRCCRRIPHPQLCSGQPQPLRLRSCLPYPRLRGFQPQPQRLCFLWPQPHRRPGLHRAGREGLLQPACR